MLFRVSLLHLPAYLLLFAAHRVPNTGALTWPRLLELLQQGTEAAERSVLRTVHGPEPPILVEGPMLFPFSPPLIMPCPYHQMKRALGASARGSGAEGRAGGAASVGAEFRGPLQDFRMQWDEALQRGCAGGSGGEGASSESAQSVLRSALVSQVRKPSAPQSAKDLLL